MEHHDLEGHPQFNMVQRNVRRIAIQPEVRRAAGVVAAGGNVTGVLGPGVATLSANPRTLHFIWQEFEMGSGGRKAAKLFTREERGKVKCKFHRTKHVWDCVAELVWAGFTAQVAIDHICQVCGEDSTVATIINRMQMDKRNHLVHPLLHVGQWGFIFHTLDESTFCSIT